jgi:tripartite-type tricarboxylate transporter receptor subunit TctC
MSKSTCASQLRRRFAYVRATFAGVLLFALTGSASAEWPDRPVRVISPFGAGGAADVMARLFSDGLSQAFGQQFIVENRTGAGGLIGTLATARAEPDGYMLMGGGMSAHVLAPAANKNPGYDPIKDFTHIALFGGAPSLILVHPSLGVKSFKELADLARKSNGIEYVSPGTGTVGHILIEAVAAKEKIKLVHVPYRSGAAAVIDLLAGRVKVGTLNWSTAREQIAPGRLWPVTVSSAKRLAALPDLPTLSELGYPDLVTVNWHSLAGPAGMPKEIVGALNREVVKLVERPEMRKHFETDAVETRAMSQAEFAQFVRGEVEKWTPIVRTAVKVE